MTKMILVILLAVFAAIGFVSVAVAGGGTDQENGNGVEFYISTPQEMYILPGEQVYAQYGIHPVDSNLEMTMVKAQFWKYPLFTNFYWDDPMSGLELEWNSFNESEQEGLSSIGSLYFHGQLSDTEDSFAWYSNTERGLPFLFLFHMSFVNVAPVGAETITVVSTSTAFGDKSNGFAECYSTYVSVDGIRGDVNGDGKVTQKDVDLLPFYQQSWISYEGRFTKAGLNYGRGSVLFSSPDDVSTWLLNVYVHDHNNPILEGLGIGKLMSETAYVHTDVDAVTSATSVGKVARKLTITRNVPFTSSTIGNSLTVKTAGDVVNVSAILPSGKRWQETSWVANGEVQFKLPDSNLKYQIDVVKLPGREVATAVEETVPKPFSLGQNYPNPFNPSTTIPFSLMKSEKVRVDVFNVAGQKVDTLVNGQMSAGVHSVQWQPKNGLASGTYIVRLQAGQNISNQRIMFTK